MTSAEHPYRVAVYWAPKPDSPLWLEGSRWLGRDAATGQALAQPPVPGVPPELVQRLTAEPRRYGLHATLKAPFRLRPGIGLDAVDAALDRLSAEHRAQALGPLSVTAMGSFLALSPSGQVTGVNALAEACVRQLQGLAQPLTAADVQRRKSKLGGATLTAHQEALLVQWGYPWVFDQFRFHCSLTGTLNGLGASDAAQAIRGALSEAARQRFAQSAPQHVDALAVFIEPQEGADFVLHRHWNLRAP